MSARAGASVALVGLRGSGKSRVGRLLAEHLGWPFADLDEELAREAGAAAAGEVLSERGEEAFRDLEQEVLARCAAAPGPRVLATGGGVVEREANRRLLAGELRCVWLVAEPATLLARTAADPSARPALTELAPLAEVELLAERRAPLYGEVAEARVSTEGADAAGVAERVLRALGL